MNKQPYELKENDTILIDFKEVKITKCPKTGMLQFKVPGKTIKLHRFVFRLFVGAITTGAKIIHKDGNIYNNHPSNLKQILPHKTKVPITLADKSKLHQTLQKRGTVKITKTKQRGKVYEYYAARINFRNKRYSKNFTKEIDAINWLENIRAKLGDLIDKGE